MRPTNCNNGYPCATSTATLAAISLRDFLPFNGTDEEFYIYFQWMISVIYDSTSGVSTLQVEAFKPQDSLAVTNNLLELAELLVNRINSRMLADAIKFADEEVKEAKKRLIDAQLAVLNFRNKELIIDPNNSSVIVTELIASLSAGLTDTQTQMSQMQKSSPSNLQLPSFQRRIDAIRAQIVTERTRISDTSNSLSAKLAEYESLNLNLEFAKKSLTTATSSLEHAR